MTDAQAQQQRALDELEELIGIKREYQQLRAAGQLDLAKYRKLRNRLETFDARVSVHAEQTEQALIMPVQFPQATRR